MPELKITIGCSGSGKSTYAKSLVDIGWKEINRDGDESYMWSRYKYSRKKEALVTYTCVDLFNQFKRDENNVICSDTNLSLETREFWKGLAESSGYTYSEEVVGRELDIDDLFKINKSRLDKPVDREVIIKQWKKYYSQYGKRYTPQATLPPAIIVDIDGTIAQKSPLRGHYDWDKVCLDSPRELIISLLSQFIEKGYHIIFLSGRMETCYDETYMWIQEYINVEREMFTLYMRKEDDMRKDRLVKQEFFWNEIADNWNVKLAIDDRPTIVRLWKDIGIYNVIDVSNSYGEF